MYALLTVMAFLRFGRAIVVVGMIGFDRQGTITVTG